MYLINLAFLLFLLQGCFLSFQPEGGVEGTIRTKSVWKQLPQKERYPDSSLIPVDKDMRKVVYLAKAQLGTPYHYGGMDENGFDCSGFVCYVYLNALNKKLPHNAKMLSEYVQIYDLDELEEGDLVFFDTSGRDKINHVGIYLGNGKFIHASSGKVYSVTISDLTKGFYKRAFRWGGKVKRW